jgi:hypothetical protein
MLHVNINRREKNMNKCIFISYRRDDSRDVVGRMCDRLVKQLGDENVFLDVDSIPLGVDFRRILREEVGRCHALIAVIGPGWLNALDNTGKRRLDDPDDFVRIEVEAAFERDTPVILALVNGAQTPPVERLPASLQRMANTAKITLEPGGDFQGEIDRLLAIVQTAHPPPRRNLAADERFVASVRRARDWAIAGAVLGLLIVVMFALIERLNTFKLIQHDGIRLALALFVFTTVLGLQPVGGAIVGWRLARVKGAVCGFFLACLYEILLFILPIGPAIMTFSENARLDSWLPGPPISLRVLSTTGVQIAIAGMGIVGLSAGVWAMSRWPRSWVRRRRAVILRSILGGMIGAILGFAIGVAIEMVVWHYTTFNGYSGIFFTGLICEFTFFGAIAGFLARRKQDGQEQLLQ